MKRLILCWRTAIVVALLAVPRVTLAQADEIQVYDGGLATVGTFNLTLHNNFTPKGGKISVRARLVKKDNGSSRANGPTSGLR